MNDFGSKSRIIGSYRPVARENADTSDLTDEEIEKFLEYDISPDKFEDELDHEYMNGEFGKTVGKFVLGYSAGASVFLAEPLLGISGIGISATYFLSKVRSGRIGFTTKKGVEDAIKNEKTRREHEKRLETAEQYLGKGYVVKAHLGSELSEEDKPELTKQFYNVDADVFEEFFTGFDQEAREQAKVRNMGLDEDFEEIMDVVLNDEDSYEITDTEIEVASRGTENVYTGIINGRTQVGDSIFEDFIEEEAPILKIKAVMNEEDIGETYEQVKEDFEQNRQKEKSTI